MISYFFFVTWRSLIFYQIAMYCLQLSSVGEDGFFLLISWALFLLGSSQLLGEVLVFYSSGGGWSCFFRNLLCRPLDIKWCAPKVREDSNFQNLLCPGCPGSVWFTAKKLAAVGFEPTPSKWLVPKTSALDHSATLPQNEVGCSCNLYHKPNVHGQSVFIFQYLEMCLHKIYTYQLNELNCIPGLYSSL